MEDYRDGKKSQIPVRIGKGRPGYARSALSILWHLQNGLVVLYADLGNWVSFCR